MKRLYHCSAHYDNKGLISYSTRVVNIQYNDKEQAKVILYNYRSSTTLQHMRKYIRLLEEEREFRLAHTIRTLYRIAGENKDKNWIIQDFDGKIMVI